MMAAKINTPMVATVNFEDEGWRQQGQLLLLSSDNREVLRQGSEHQAY